MLGDNIKKYRREKGFTQETLAAQLHVVRQTLSKWEHNASVPDADVLIRISGALGVSVSALLDMDQEGPPADLALELARVNEELADRERQLQRNTRAGKKRGLILLLSFAALLVTIHVPDPTVSLAVVGICLALALLILYRNLPLLCESTLSATQLRALKAATVFSAVFWAVSVAFCGLLQAGLITLTDHQERWLLMGVFSCVFLFFGAISPRLPFQRHTGLRLPWTAMDEDTWNLAHKIIGVIALPVTLLYLAAALSAPDLSFIAALSLIALAVYIGIPGVMSLIFFWKKYH